MLLRQALRRVAASASPSTSTSTSPAALLFRASSSSSSAAAAIAAAVKTAAGGSQPPPPPPPPSQPPRRARWLLFLPSAAAAFLCHWQLERWDWKKGMLEERARALRGEPWSLEEVLSALRRDRDRDGEVGGRGAGGGGDGGRSALPREMTRVVVGGSGSGSGDDDRGCSSFSFDPSSTLLVGPRPRSFGGSTVGGSLVVTPLRRRRSRRRRGGKEEEEEEEEGALVVRGWVPSGWSAEDDDEVGGQEKKDERKEKEKKNRRRRSSPPTLLCVLRVSESPSRFVPHNDPSAKLWHWIDAGEMAAAVGLPREGTPLLEVVVADYSANADGDGGAPPFDVIDGSNSGFGGLLRDEEEKVESSKQANIKEEKRRPSLMEVLGGRTAERGSGSPRSLVDPPPSPPPSSSSSSSAAAPSSSSSKKQQQQPRPQPRSLEEVSRVPVSPGQHLQYAATWGTLAVATAALAVKGGRRGGG